MRPAAHGLWDCSRSDSDQCPAWTSVTRLTRVQYRYQSAATQHVLALKKTNSILHCQSLARPVSVVSCLGDSCYDTTGVCLRLRPVCFLIWTYGPCIVVKMQSIFNHVRGMVLAMTVSVGRSTTSVQTEICQQLLDGMPWNFEQTFAEEDESKWLWMNPWRFLWCH